MRTPYLLANTAIAAVMCVFALPVKADGFTSDPVAVTNISRPFTCYGKVYGTGEFINHRVSAAGVTIDGLGNNSLGLTGQIGCDISNDRFLIGAFADYTWNKAQVNINAGVPLMSMPLSNEASIGARLGVWAKPGVLIYGLAAYTVAQESLTMAALPIGLNGPKGATLGGGIEINLGRGMLVTLEYRHTAFDTNTATLLPMTFDTVENSVRAGVGYRF